MMSNNGTATQLREEIKGLQSRLLRISNPAKRTALHDRIQARQRALAGLWLEEAVDETPLATHRAPVSAIRLGGYVRRDTFFGPVLEARGPYYTTRTRIVYFRGQRFEFTHLDRANTEDRGVEVYLFDATGLPCFLGYAPDLLEATTCVAVCEMIAEASIGVAR